MRMDKAGVGDSEGDCGATDFIAELAAYRQAFRRLKSYAFVDPDRIFIFGISNGRGFAPLVAEAAPVRGYVVDGGWIKTWYEHMLEIERRRLTLAGHGAPELNTLMKRIEVFYSGYLLDRLPPKEILARRPELAGLVNRNAPGAAEMVELPATGHTFDHYASQEDAFAGKTLPFDDRIAQRITQWFERHR